jgi:beta-xylosidase
VAIADRPEGPFKAEPRPIEGSYSIDPALLADEDGSHYLYFGGLWGGQLQKYRDNTYAGEHAEPAPDEPALGPRVARLSADMTQFAEPPREVVILDEDGRPLRAGDHDRRYFEGPWMHRYRGRYYLSYSTGNTHCICYAVGDNPYGPFTWQGVVLTPVLGWTSHHSIVEFGGRWWLYYHDAVLSGGVTHLRSIKVTELHHDAQGRIATVHPYGE